MDRMKTINNTIITIIICVEILRVNKHNIIRMTNKIIMIHQEDMTGRITIEKQYEWLSLIILISGIIIAFRSKH
jgi:hypothetical protein